MACILVVDDDEAVCSALRMLLEFEGYRVLAVGSGQAALEAVRGSQVDLVVLDLILPGMPGHAVISSLRRTAPRLPIIATSGYLFRDLTAPEEDVLTSAVALGAGLALRKPFKARDLLGAVSASLATASKAGADETAPAPSLPPPVAGRDPLGGL